MKISVIGGSGFVGQTLIKELSNKKYAITSIDINTPPLPLDKVKYITADTTKPGKWQEEVSDSDAVINLAGVTIFSFWTKAYKELVYSSRILTTRNIVDAIDEQSNTTLLSTSAAGYYGDQKNTLLNEESEPGNDFLANVCKDWENEALKALTRNTRVCLMRFGIVIGNGGALSKMIPLTRMVINPVLGSGLNFFPWIHIKDLCKAIIHLLENENLSGAFNLTSPGFTTQKEFTKKLAALLERPVLFHMPEFLIKTFGGDLGKSFLCSQKAYPEKLLNSEFKFQLENLEEALSFELKTHT